MPAKPGIVEVDNRGLRPFDEHVARMQVGMDQAERASRLAIAGQCRVQPLPRAEKHVASDGENTEWSQNGPQNSSGPISPSASSACRWNQAGGVQLVAWSCIAAYGANVRKVACVRRAVGFTCNHIGEQFDFHPARQASQAPFPGCGGLDLGEVLTPLR